MTKKKTEKTEAPVQGPKEAPKGGEDNPLELLLPEYISHKVVRATKIIDILEVETSTGNHVLAVLVNDVESVIPVTQEWMDKRTPEPGGYFVVYEDGYTSYSPAKAFEEGYTPSAPQQTTRLTGEDVPPEIPAYQQRVIEESEELNERLAKLNQFIVSNLFMAVAKDEQVRLKAQKAAMAMYAAVLNERIANFPPTNG
jgi:hypothetical protein